MGQSSGLWAIGCVLLDSDGLIDDRVVGESTRHVAGLGGSEESEDGEESLNSLHFCGWNDCTASVTKVVFVREKQINGK